MVETKLIARGFQLLSPIRVDTVEVLETPELCQGVDRMSGVLLPHPETIDIASSSVKEQEGFFVP